MSNGGMVASADLPPTSLPSQGRDREEAALRRPEPPPKSLPSQGRDLERGSPLRKLGPYFAFRSDGSRRRCPRFLQAKLLKFLLAYEADANIYDGLLAAGVTRRQFQRWLAAIPAFAADVQDIRDDDADRYEKLLSERIRQGDRVALREKLRAERPEKWDSKHRHPQPAAPLSLISTKRLDLTRTNPYAARIPNAEPEDRWAAAERLAEQEEDIWADRQVHPPIVQ